MQLDQEGYRVLLLNCNFYIGTCFGLMDEMNNIRGTGKVTARSTLHDRKVPPNCLVVEVSAMEDDWNEATISRTV